MKKVIAVLVSLILSVTIVFILPDFLNTTSAIDNNHLNESSLIPQEVTGYVEKKNTYHKLYKAGDLIGVITDLDYFNKLIDDEYTKYEDDFPNTSLGLTDDLYIVDEVSNLTFENIDTNIVNYLVENELLGIKTTAVEFSTEEGVFDIIYVNSQDDFVTARNQFFQNFVSEETLQKLNNNVSIASPTTFGSVETNIKVQETMTFSEAIVTPSKIFTNINDIYNYLCYGRETERTYYETKEGDTVQAVGYYFGDMTARQVMMLNPDVLQNENQVLAPGTKLNVTYYTSPLTVVVTKQRLAQETVLPDSPLYIEDPSVRQGTRSIERNESNGIQNVLYEEIWVNGVVQSGSEISSSLQVEPVQAIIRVGTMHVPDIGTGNWGYPVNNPMITCNYTCYANHGGVDFQNMYNRYDVVIAADSGVVESTGYTDIGGFYVRVNHNNGYMTYYGHMRSYPYVSVGQTVERGDVLGPIGMTGLATGPHVHFAMYYNNSLINPCSQLACSAVPWS